MRILSIDVGAGTMDVLVYDDSVDRMENLTKIIAPSPTRRYAKLLEDICEKAEGVVVIGETMGGGPFSSAIKKLLAKGKKIFMTERAARTIRDDLDFVRSLGIEIVSEEDASSLGEKYPVLRIGDVDLESLRRILEDLGEEWSFDCVAVAVQDHGVPSERIPERLNRFLIFRKLVDKSRDIRDLYYTPGNLPENLTRMRAVLRSISRSFDGEIVISDSSYAAVVGCVLDSGFGELLASNLGNAHTIIASLNEWEIRAWLEHHTRLLTPESFRNYLMRVWRGEVTFEDVYRDGGHGALVLERSTGSPSEIIITGPNIEIAKRSGLSFRQAAPAGDVMLTGAFGLVEIARRHIRS